VKEGGGDQQDGRGLNGGEGDGACCGERSVGSGSLGCKRMIAAAI